MRFALAGRAAKRLLVLAAVVVVLAAAVLWALPEVVRRVAVDQASKTLGRQVAIDDVDLNLFSRHLAVKKLRVAEAEGPEAFVAFDRLDVYFSYWPLVHGDVRLRSIALDGLAVRAARTDAARFSFSDILDRMAKAAQDKPAPEKPPGPSKWTVTIDRVDVSGASIAATDRHVAPAAEWRIDGLAIHAARITTHPDHGPGTLEIETRLNGESALSVQLTSLKLDPLAAAARIKLTDFDLARVRPYVPPDAPASPRTGKLAVDLALTVEKDAEALRKAGVSGQVRLDGLSIQARGQDDAFAAVNQLVLGIKEADLVARAAVVTVELDGLDAKAARNKAGEVDLVSVFTRSAADAPAGDAPASDAAKPAAPPETGAAKPDAGGGAPPPPFRLTVERVALRSGSLALADDGVTPARRWKIEDLTVDGAGLATAPDAPPGKLAARARITSSPGSAKPATLALDADSVRLLPLAASARLALTGFDVASAIAYLPPALPAAPAKGTLGVDLTAKVEKGESGLSRALVSGTVNLADTAIVQRGAPKPFLALPRLAVAIKEVDAVAHAVTLSRIELQGLDVRAIRDAKGVIDLLALAGPPSQEGEPARAPAAPRRPPPPPPPPGVAPSHPTPAPVPSGDASAAPPAATAAKPAGPDGPWRVAVDRFVLSKGTATFDDQAITPASTFALRDIAITAERLSWPPTSRAALSLSVTMPGGGRTEIKGGGTLEPLNIQVTTVTTDAPIDPYQPYFPFPARLSGLFSGDSLNEIQRAPDGSLILASRGNALAKKIEVRGPDSDEPVSRTEELEIQKIDFSWPNYALVDLVRIKHPEVQVERDAGGELNMRRLFEPKKKEGGQPEGQPAEKPAEPPPAEETKPSDKPAEPATVLDFKEVRIEDGFLRFLDKTTKPAFSEDISKLQLVVRDLSNVLGRQRTTMTIQALVGGDAALDLRGEMSGLAEAFHADLVGEIRDFALSAANPYADNLTSWVVQRGKLTAKVHYRIDGDRLSAEHDVKFAGLNVQKARASDEAKQKLGLPLGLAVALLKDRRGDIDFEVPLHGTLSDKKFDWGEAMWSGIKQVLVKVLAAPFNAIGRMFSGGDDKGADLAINPVTFEPGSSVIAPAAELQITRVADFLRRSPYVKLDLSAVATKADAQSLKSHEALARVQLFQKEKGLEDLPAALKAYYQEKLPGVTPPEGAEAQLAKIAESQEAPPAELADLTARRLDGVKDRLVKVEGIPAERVAPAKADAPPAPAEGDGRVEFAIAAE